MGIVLPVSGVILANLDDYVETQEHSNKKRQSHFDWMKKDENERAELAVQNAFAD